jgi:hypothetical protein
MPLSDYFNLRTCEATDGTKCVSGLMPERFAASLQTGTKPTRTRTRESEQESTWGQKGAGGVPYQEEVKCIGLFASGKSAGKRCTANAAPDCISSCCGRHCDMKDTCPVHKIKGG